MEVLVCAPLSSLTSGADDDDDVCVFVPCLVHCEGDDRCLRRIHKRCVANICISQSKSLYSFVSCSTKSKEILSIYCWFMPNQKLSTWQWPSRPALVLRQQPTDGENQNNNKKHMIFLLLNCQLFGVCLAHRHTRAQRKQSREKEKCNLQKK